MRFDSSKCIGLGGLALGVADKMDGDSSSAAEDSDVSRPRKAAQDLPSFHQRLIKLVS